MRLRRITRSPAAFWLGAVSLALCTGLLVAGLVGRAAAEAARFGRLRTVAVATRALEPGRVVAPADIATRRLPAALVPAGAAPSPAGRTVVVRVFPGEVVLRGQLAPWGLRGVAALLPPGTRAVTVPLHDTDPVRRGDIVDVLASFDPSVSGGRDPTFAVAEGALVVAVGDGSVTVAVSPDEATHVAFAAANGVVALAIGRAGDE